MKTTVAIACLLLIGCAAPKDSRKHFPRPKYSIAHHVRLGRPAVAQRWWSRAWFWQPRQTPYTRSIR